MTTFVVATGSVDASAALCDYLDGRLADGDAVHAVAWLPDGVGRTASRDAADALNGVRSRLGVRASVEIHRLGGGWDGGEGTADGVVEGLLALAAEVAADELVVGSGGDGLDAGSLTALLSETTRPVVVIPEEGRGP